MKTNKTFIIIDSSALLYRSFHALPPLTTKKGKQTGAIYGFFLAFFKALRDLKPDFVVATFDFPAITFRHKKYKHYKEKRPAMPKDLSQQIPVLKKILKALNIPIFEKKGFEADDLIATISKKIKQEKSYSNIKTYILTADFDLLQLIDKDVNVYFLRRGVKDTLIYDKEKVIDRFEFLPNQIIEFKSLAGDASDNIPGAPGIGKKTATILLKKFKDLKRIYKKVEQDSKEINPRTKKILIENKKQVFLSKELVVLEKSIPIVFNIKECKFGDFKKENVERVFKEIEFHSLIKRLLIVVKEIKDKNKPIKKNLKMNF